ncbi:hypothetical protein NOF79_004072 [Salmonella enterica]|nr:hypothetical protein [Salmonella enterica]EJM3430795.1 hypothetical protein [Salmonella enterica]
MRKFAKGLIATAALTAVSVSSAFAEGTGPDYTTLTNGFDFTSTVGAIMAVGVGAVGLLLAMVGIKKVFLFVKTI